MRKIPWSEMMTPVRGYIFSPLHVNENLHGGLAVFVDVLIGLQVVAKREGFAHQGGELDFLFFDQTNGVEVVLVAIIMVVLRSSS